MGSRDCETLEILLWLIGSSSAARVFSCPAWCPQGMSPRFQFWSQHLACFHTCGDLIGNTLWMVQERLSCWHFLESHLSCYPTCSIRKLGGFFLSVEHPLPIGGFIVCPLCPGHENNQEFLFFLGSTHFSLYILYIFRFLRLLKKY